MMTLLHYLITPIVLIILFSISFLSCKKEKLENDSNEINFVIENPYKGVNWQTCGQYKASLHTHTSVSDGILAPHQLVDAYKYLDYHILSITDHNNVTYPWENFDEQVPSNWAYHFLEEGIITEDDLIYENRYPDQLGMLAILGNELSNHHHLGSYFIDYNGMSSDINVSLDAITELNGLGFLCHPIKYSKSTDWYYDLFDTYQNLVGIEVYNKKYEYSEEIYFDDINLWDSLLSMSMPTRNIYGFTNDDFHTVELGYAYTMFLMHDFTATEVQNSMKNGSFYFVILSDGHNGNPHPKINSINIGQNSDYIEIIAENYDYIEWISHGNVVHTGNKINLSELSEDKTYVRAMIYQNNYQKIAGTQAFGISRSQLTVDN